METYQDFFNANRDGWNKRTQVHLSSESYNLEAWKKGWNSLTAIELEELGPVVGKSILHLQCHFGQDTLSLARMGAEVCGCDLSDEAIKTARALSEELGLSASFVCCNVYDLPEYLVGEFDIVYTSFGVIGWLPDLAPWADVINHFLKPGGAFYLAEFHPVVWMFDDDLQKLVYPYKNSGPIKTENHGTYANRDADIHYTDYGWNHGIGDVVNNLRRHDLQIERLNEYLFSPFDCFPNTVKGEDGNYRIKGLEGIIPMVYSLTAKKPVS